MVVTHPSLRAVGTNRNTLAGAWAGGTEYGVNFVLLNKFVCFVFCVTLFPVVISPWSWSFFHTYILSYYVDIFVVLCFVSHYLYLCVKCFVSHHSHL
jgi:hypothetical protein